MADTTHIEITFSSEVRYLSHVVFYPAERKDYKSQAKSDIHEGRWGSSMSNGPNGAASVMTTPNLRLATADAPRLRGALENDDSEIKCAPAGLPDAHYEHPFPC